MHFFILISILPLSKKKKNFQIKVLIYLRKVGDLDMEVEMKID
jgi:hypothetical protein